MVEKITMLHRSLKALPITDFNMEEIATTFVTNGGWNDNKDFGMALNDCLCYMAIRLVNRRL